MGSLFICLIAGAALVWSGSRLAGQSTRPTSAPSDASRLVVTFSGGFDTEPRDHGRPVVLVAAALGVPADVFRKAFSNVKPAPQGQQPQPDQVRRNKKALMDALEPYGVTNDRLDEVSNYYRYNRGKGEMWRNKPASAYAVVRDGAISEFVITDAGAGYSSPPSVSIDSMPDVKIIATLSLVTDLKKNGSIKELAVAKP